MNKNMKVCITFFPNLIFFHAKTKMLSQRRFTSGSFLHEKISLDFAVKDGNQDFRHRYGVPVHALPRHLITKFVDFSQQLGLIAHCV